jgi:hypothetical protein
MDKGDTDRVLAELAQLGGDVVTTVPEDALREITVIVKITVLAGSDFHARHIAKEAMSAAEREMSDDVVGWRVI